jgi:AhpD family alkylhydroperoxidase
MKALPANVLIHEWPLMKKYVLGETKIPGKYREMIGLAISANLKCPYCQLFHTGVAKMQGASDEELAEIYFLASFASRWSAMIHAQHYNYDKFEEEIHKIGGHLKKQASK